MKKNKTYRLNFLGNDSELIKKEAKMVEEINKNFKKKYYFCYMDDYLYGIVGKEDFALFLNWIAPTNERGNEISHIEVEIENNGNIIVSKYDKTELIGYYTLKDISSLTKEEKNNIIDDLCEKHEILKEKIKNKKDQENIMDTLVNILINELNGKIEY